eukprot:3304970-Alexandrium_andersonii.AAC.1
MDFGLALPLGHHRRVHARVVHVGVQAAPIRAWRAARDHIRPFCPQDANDNTAILRSIKIPGHAPRPQAQ